MFTFLSPGVSLLMAHVSAGHSAPLLSAQLSLVSPSSSWLPIGHCSAPLTPPAPLKYVGQGQGMAQGPGFCYLSPSQGLPRISKVPLFIFSCRGAAQQIHLSVFLSVCKQFEICPSFIIDWFLTVILQNCTK